MDVGVAMGIGMGVVVGVVVDVGRGADGVQRYMGLWAWVSMWAWMWVRTWARCGRGCRQGRGYEQGCGRGRGCGRGCEDGGVAAKTQLHRPPPPPSLRCAPRFHAHSPRVRAFTPHTPGAENPKPKGWCFISSWVVTPTSSSNS